MSGPGFDAVGAPHRNKSSAEKFQNPLSIIFVNVSGARPPEHEPRFCHHENEKHAVCCVVSDLLHRQIRLLHRVNELKEP